MAAAIEVISRLADRGVTFQIEDSGRLRVNGVSRLTEREKVALRTHKPAILRALATPPTVPIAAADQTPSASTTTATGPLPNHTEPPEPGSTQPFGQRELDAIKAGAGCWVWSGVLNEWCFWVADEEQWRKAVARSIDPAVIWTLNELTGMQGLPPDDLCNVAQVKRRFGGTIQPGAMPTRWRDAVSPLEPVVNKGARL